MCEEDNAHIWICGYVALAACQDSMTQHNEIMNDVGHMFYS